MDKISKLMLIRAQKLQNYLQKILENDGLKSPKDSLTDIKAPFEPRTDLSQLDDIGMGLPATLPERAQILFSRLSVYFESGMLFHLGHDDSWKPKSAFQEGEFYPLIADDRLTDFSFPQMTLVEILRLKNSPMQKVLENIGLITVEHTQVLVFKPHPEYIFLVTSLLPDLWLKTHSEKIQSKILMLLGDF